MRSLSFVGPQSVCPSTLSLLSAVGSASASFAQLQSVVPLAIGSTKRTYASSPLLCVAYFLVATASSIVSPVAPAKYCKPDANSGR